MPAEGMIVCGNLVDFISMLHYAQISDIDVAEFHAFGNFHILVVFCSDDLVNLLQWLLHQHFDSVEYFQL